MFQDSELINLAMVCLAAVILLFFLHRGDCPRSFSLFYASFFAMTAGLFCTVIEGLLAPAVFNYLEHICYAASGILMAVACYRLRHNPPDTEKN